MTCFHPVKATKSFKKNSNGKHGVIFGIHDYNFGDPIELPCGQCVGCRLDRSLQWAIRCICEAQLYDKNCFITLTYDPENLPSDGSINLEHFQLFMKRLRKKYVPKNPYDPETQPKEYKNHHEKHEIRFFHCGEYGEQCGNCGDSRKECLCTKFISKPGRPHYHALLFNFEFDDKELYSDTDGQFLYTSESLNERWELGQCWIGDLTFESAAYVARYIMKKITGDQAFDHYVQICEQTGQYEEKKPEYVTMSKRPGIANRWFKIYKTDVFPHDYVYINGKKVQPPKYFDTAYGELYPTSLEELKATRVTKAKLREENNTPERLLVRETLKIRQSKKLVRKL